MRSNDLHTRLASMIDPRLDKKVVKRVNHRMDNPSKYDKFQSKAIYGLTPAANLLQGAAPRRVGHRIYNHDWPTALAIGYQEGGIEGMKAAAIHQALDMVGDIGTKSLGYRKNNLLQACMEYCLSYK